MRAETPSSAASGAGRWIAPLLAATCSAFLIDAGARFATDATPPVAYLGLALVSSLAAVAVMAVIAGVVAAGPRGALVAWVAWIALLAIGGGALQRAIAAAGFALVAWAALRHAHADQPVSAASGAATGVSLGLALVLWPRVREDLFAAIGVEGWSLQATTVPAFAVLLFGFTSYTRLRNAHPRLPATPWLGVGIVGAALAGLRATSGFSAIPAPVADPVRTPAAAGAPRAVIVLILDTLRSDRMSIYGYERDTTPELAAFLARSERAVLYPFAFSTATWTLPAHASLLSGLMPSEHGVFWRDAASAGLELEWRVPAAPDATLAEAFQRRGYRTGLIYANATLAEVPGFRRGFGVVGLPGFPRPLRLDGGLPERMLPDAFPVLGKAYPDASIMNREVLEFVDSCGSGACFLVANYMDAHWPFAAPPPHAGRFAGDHRRIGMAAMTATDIVHAADRYDEEIRWLDAKLGELLRELDGRGLLDDAWLVITSDHGEAFGEHGVTGHRTAVYNEQVRIPLLIQPPLGIQLPTPDSGVSLLDVTATLTAIAGAPSLGRGRDLRDPRASGRPVPIEFFGRPSDHRDKAQPLAGAPARAVVIGHLKLIEHVGRRELYALDGDPFEERNLAKRRPDLVQALDDHLPVLQAPEVTGGSPPSLSPDEEEILRRLGYLR